MSHRPWEESADFSIGLSPIDEARWLEGCEADPAARKDPLHAEHADLVWGEMQPSRPGQREAAALLGVSSFGDLPPLYAAARTVADDLVLVEKTDGLWRVSAIFGRKSLRMSASGRTLKADVPVHPCAGLVEKWLRRKAGKKSVPNGEVFGQSLETKNCVSLA